MIAFIRDWCRSPQPASLRSLPPVAASRFALRPQAQSAEGIELGSALSKVTPEALTRYREYLTAHLAFPFDARFCDAFESSADEHLVMATRLLECSSGLSPTADGIECEIRVLGGVAAVPLRHLRPHPGTANWRLIDAYRRWLRETR